MDASTLRTASGRPCRPAGPASPADCRILNVATTSSALKDAPSWNLTLRRSLNVQVRHFWSAPTMLRAAAAELRSCPHTGAAHPQAWRRRARRATAEAVARASRPRRSDRCDRPADALAALRVHSSDRHSGQKAEERQRDAEDGAAPEEIAARDLPVFHSSISSFSRSPALLRYFSISSFG